MLEGRSGGQGKPQQLVNLDYYGRFVTVDQQSASQGTSRNCEPSPRTNCHRYRMLNQLKPELESQEKILSTTTNFTPITFSRHLKEITSPKSLFRAKLLFPIMKIIISN